MSKFIPDKHIELLKNKISEIRSSDSTETISIVTPTNFSNFYLRRYLSSMGLFNVNLVTYKNFLYDIYTKNNKINKKFINQTISKDLIYRSISKSKYLASLIDTNNYENISEFYYLFFELQRMNLESLDKLIKNSNDFFSQVLYAYKDYKKEASKYLDEDEISTELYYLFSNKKIEILSLGKVIFIDIYYASNLQKKLFNYLLNHNNIYQISTYDTEIMSKEKINFDAITNKQSKNIADVSSVFNIHDEIRLLFRNIKNILISEKNIQMNNIAIIYEDETYYNIVTSNCDRYGLPTTTFTKTPLSQSEVGRFINEFFDLLLCKFDFQSILSIFENSNFKILQNDNKFLPNLTIEILYEANLNFVEYELDESIDRINKYIDLITKFINYKKNIFGFEQDSTKDKYEKNKILISQDILSFFTNIKKIFAEEKIDSYFSWNQFINLVSKLIKQFSFLEPDDRFQLFFDTFRKISLDNELSPLSFHMTMFLEQLSSFPSEKDNLGKGIAIGHIDSFKGCVFEYVFFIGMNQNFENRKSYIENFISKSSNNKSQSNDDIYTYDNKIEERNHTLSNMLCNSRKIFFSQSRINNKYIESIPSMEFIEFFKIKNSSISIDNNNHFYRMIIDSPGYYTREKIRISNNGIYIDSKDYELSWINYSYNINDLSKIKNLLKQNEKLSVYLENYNNSNFLSNNLGIISKFNHSINSFSSTSLDRYIRCPYDYFIHDILKINTNNEINGKLFFSNKDLGIFIHDILESFVKWKKQNINRNYEEYKNKLLHFSQIRLDREYSLIALKPIHLFEIEKKKIDNLLIDWLKHEIQNNYMPSLTEIIFEKKLQLLDDKIYSFNGRIDRLDIGSDGDINLYDYKTGKVRKNKEFYTLDYFSIQLFLYSLVLSNEHAGKNIMPHYWYINNENKSVFSLEFLKKDVSLLLTKILNRINDGHFFPSNSKVHHETFECSCKIVFSNEVINKNINKDSFSESDEIKNIIESMYKK